MFQKITSVSSSDADSLAGMSPIPFDSMVVLFAILIFLSVSRSHTNPSFDRVICCVVPESTRSSILDFVVAWTFNGEVNKCELANRDHVLEVLVSDFPMLLFLCFSVSCLIKAITHSHLNDIWLICHICDTAPSTSHHLTMT